MKNVVSVALLFFVFLFISCSKSKDTNETTTTSQVQAKWYLKKWISNDVSSGGTRPASGNYDPGDYLQLNTGGNLTAMVDSEISQGVWKLLNNNTRLFLHTPKLDAPDEGYDIKTLNSSNLVLYFREGTATTYSEITIYLEK